MDGLSICLLISVWSSTSIKLQHAAISRHIKRGGSQINRVTEKFMHLTSFSKTEDVNIAIRSKYSV